MTRPWPKKTAKPQANIIVAEQSERFGIPIPFRRHLAIGFPVALVSLAISALFISLW